jgi:2'-5' RNA ligase
VRALICVVEDVFQIGGGGGCVIAPGVPRDSGLRVRVGDDVLLTRPDGSVLETTVRGIPMGGRADLPRVPIALSVADKSQVPVGTRVWLVSDPAAHAELAGLYGRMWDDAAPAIRAGRVTMDPWVTRRHADERRGIALLARPAFAVRRRIGRFLDELRALEPGQHFYPAASLHLTVLTPLSATADHGPHLAHLAAYRDAVAGALAGERAFWIDIQGVTASREAVLAQGFPRNGTLERIRARLRDALAARGLGSADQRYRLRSAHLTLARFAAPLRDPAAFGDALEAARGRDFGTMQAAELELVVSDWYQSADATRTVARVPLGAT